MSNILIIGASAGIGRALVFEYARHGHKVGALARRVDLMRETFAGIPGCLCGYIDVNAEDAVEHLNRFIAEMGGVDVCIITAGLGYVNKELDWEKERITLETNVLAFSKLSVAMFLYFKAKEPVKGRRPKRGHLAGISSIAGFKGLDMCPAYSSSKGYDYLFLQALRRKSNKERLGVKITTVIPGFVDTGLVAGNEYLFWVVPVEKAARQIYRGMKYRWSLIFVSKRWGIIARILRQIPGIVYERI